MHKLRIKKKITKSDKIILPFFDGNAVKAKALAPKKAVPKTEATPVSHSPDIVSEPQNPIQKPAGAKRKVKKNILSSFSISINPNAQVKNIAEEKVVQNNVFKINMNQPLEAELLMKAWEALRADISQNEITLKQCIKTSSPKILSNSEFTVVVSNNFQADNLRENTNRVVLFLQNKLQNSNLQMVIEVSDSKESVVVFTANDKFKLMLEKNPELEQFRKRLDLEID